MAELLTATEVRARFAKRLRELAREINEVCDDWQETVDAGMVPRADLVLNVTMATRSLAYLDRFGSEIRHKLKQAVSGLYRWRELEGREGNGGESSQRSA